MNPSDIRQIHATTERQNNNITQEIERTDQENPFTANAVVSRSTIRTIDSPQEFENRSSEENAFSHAEIDNDHANIQDIVEHVDCFLKRFKKLKIVPDYIMEQIKNGNVEKNLENGQLEKDIMALDNRYHLSRTGLVDACLLITEAAVAMIKQTIHTFARDLIINWRNTLYRPDTASRKKGIDRLYHMAILKMNILQQIIAKQNKNLDALKHPELKVEFSNYPIYRITRDYYWICGPDNRPPNTPFGVSSGNSFP